MPTSTECRCGGDRIDPAKGCYRDFFSSNPVLILFGLTTTILSLGISVAMVSFVFLSFKEPNAAAVIIPPIIASVATLVAVHGGKIRDAIRTYRANITAIGAGGQEGAGTIQLGGAATTAQPADKPVIK